MGVEEKHPACYPIAVHSKLKKGGDPVSDQTYFLLMGILGVLILLVLLALLVLLIQQVREEKPIRKGRRRKKKHSDLEGLPKWVYIAGAILLLVVAAAVLAGLYFLIRAVWLFLAAHMWIVWATLIGVGLWSAIRSLQDEDAPAWVQIIGLLFMVAVVLAVLFGLYLAVTAVFKVIVAVVTAATLWIAEVKEAVRQIPLGAIFVIVAGIAIALLIAKGSEDSGGNQRSNSSPSSSSDGWGDYSDYGSDDSARSRDSDDEPEHEQGAYHCGWLGTPGYYYDYRDDPDDPDYDVRRYRH
ncbi:hypothetical protein A2890_02515 [candidate division WWE3 bacterium RIFCSPLOWO2_01_FULL_53_14]|uniref:Uncharacterized protein n=1 Tax=candidate division WWE3 bacterium RIFCSPLOWO2_01_FULL_53_14 TaxID=1802628 RepID=A0A1F4VTB7_UNCKA|nr:MAG: hypothetical protein A2890_02515 [candidate division WWE3 bacterium RIFCSPLOWO2_01_FULL_53_14]